MEHRAVQSCSRTPHSLLLAIGVLCGAMAGCGVPGPVRAPSLQLPQVVTDLTVQREADSVRLAWTTPRLSTDKLALKSPVDARICRTAAGNASFLAAAAAPCVRAQEITVQPGQAATFEDHLPSQLTIGAPQLLTYTVELVNHSGRSAGLSNKAYSASGPAPEPLALLRCEVRADGVLLQWQPRSGSSAAPPRQLPTESPTFEEAFVRIHRTLDPEKPGTAKQTAAAKSPSAAAKPASGLQLKAPPEEEHQTLIVPEDGPDAAAASQGKALDTNAAFDRNYTYSAQRVVDIQLDGHSITIAGLPSAPVTVSTRDIFPPATPSGLVAITVPDDHAIDLSWTPDTEADLVGYIVYRRSADGGRFERLSPAPVAAPSYRDTSAAAGRKYAYSVSAIDRDGNESARSGEVDETLPPPQ